MMVRCVQFKPMALQTPLPQKHAGNNRFGAENSQGQERMSALAQQYPVIRRMFEMIDIPSATPQADPRHHQPVTEQMARMKALVIKSFQDLKIPNLQIEENEWGSLIIRVPGSPGYEKARPLMLTAHMDIVAGNPLDPTRPVQRRLFQHEGREFIGTDGTTTLGADDKGGLSIIIENVANLKNKPHVPIEIVLSPDEESSCDSLRKLDTSKFKARHVIVVDEFNAFKVVNGLASAVEINVKVTGTNGGHSGVDITRPNRLNAIDLMSRMVPKIGTGPVTMHPHYPNMPLISKNIGMMQGGTASNAIPESANMTIMMRSFDKDAQSKELTRMDQLFRNYERRHRQTQPNLKIKMDWQEHYPAWQGDPKSVLPGVCQDASKAMNGPEVQVGPIHAAAQASILANKKNAYGEQFDAILIGPHIEEAHTVRERVDWQSVVHVNDWLGKIIEHYTVTQAKPGKPRPMTTTA